MTQHVIHPWPPVFNEHSRVLILGTIPSPRSRKEGFYYGHPANIFWSTLAWSLGVETPGTSPHERESFCLEHCVALWDVLAACDINGAADSSISNPKFNDFAPMLSQTRIHTIFATGRTACDLFNKNCAHAVGMQAIYLPSTSPANRATQAKPIFKERWAYVGQALRDGAPNLASLFGATADPTFKRPNELDFSDDVLRAQL
jgi:hypoxanthine-DNA glycosylase